mmetsp:Transcript_11092/g.28030  ORF Transcript_11092/g.28030 Transcript_11092/m.28030 type:complete len:315 (-) Transcript_11092:474-1418(-)
MDWATLSEILSMFLSAFDNNVVTISILATICMSFQLMLLASMPLQMFCTSSRMIPRKRKERSIDKPSSTTLIPNHFRGLRNQVNASASSSGLVVVRQMTALCIVASCRLAAAAANLIDLLVTLKIPRLSKTYLYLLGGANELPSPNPDNLGSGSLSCTGTFTESEASRAKKATKRHNLKTPRSCVREYCFGRHNSDTTTTTDAIANLVSRVPRAAIRRQAKAMICLTLASVLCKKVSGLGTYVTNGIDVRDTNWFSNEDKPEAFFRDGLDIPLSVLCEARTETSIPSRPSVLPRSLWYSSKARQRMNSALFLPG